MPVTASLLDHKVLGREYKMGFAAGLENVVVKGEARMLRHQLEFRFKKLPKWVADKLATATSAQLEEWAIRLVDKKSLAAIFDRD